MLDLVIGVQAGGAAIGGAHWLIACIAIAQLALLGHCADAHDGHAPEQITVWGIRYTGLVRGIRWVSGTCRDNIGQSVFTLYIIYKRWSHLDCHNRLALLSPHSPRTWVSRHSSRQRRASVAVRPDMLTKREVCDRCRVFRNGHAHCVSCTGCDTCTV